MSKFTINPRVPWADFIKPYMEACGPLLGPTLTKRFNRESRAGKEDYVDSFVEKCLSLIERECDLYHLVCRTDLAPAIFAHSAIVFTGVSCECTCAKIGKAHIHAIVEKKCSEMTFKRYMKEVYVDLGMTTKKGSNFNYKFISIKHYQHLISTVMYLTRKKVWLDKSTIPWTKRSAHHNFTPWGITDVSQIKDDRIFMTDLWHRIWKNFKDKDHEELVQFCEQKYKEYHIEKQAKNAISKAQRYRRADAAALSLNDIEASVGPTSPTCSRAIFERREMAKETYTHGTIAKNSISNSVIYELCDDDLSEGKRDRLVFIPNRPQYFCDILLYSIGKAREEENTMLGRRVRLRQILSREIPDLVYVDDGCAGPSRSELQPWNELLNSPENDISN